MGFPHVALKFPYKRQSPISRRKKTYKSMEDVWQDIDKLINKWQDSKYTLGRNLYFHLPLFMDPKWITDPNDNILLKEYNWIKDFNIPLAKDLDNADAEKIEIFDIINREIKSIQNYMSEQHGR